MAKNDFKMVIIQLKPLFFQTSSVFSALIYKINTKNRKIIRYMFFKYINLDFCLSVFVMD